MDKPEGYGPYYKLQEEADLGQERREMFLELMASYHSLPSLADKPPKCLGFGHIESRTEDPHSDLWQVEFSFKGYDELPRTFLFSYRASVNSFRANVGACVWTLGNAGMAAFGY